MLARLLMLLCLFAGPARADVLVFAAASLKEPLDEITAPMDGVRVSYAGSGTLARQITLGAPADVVLLANVEWMDVLVEGGHVKPGTVQDFASNRLVLVGPAEASDVPLTPAGLDAALGDGRMALGMTEAVPAGIYARTALTELGLWDGLEDRLAEVDSVRSALALVIRGQAPLGIVYASDARISDAIRPLATFPAESHPPIRYTAALTTNAAPEATAVLTALMGPEGQMAIAAAGFLPPVETSGD
ncbi:MAG: molybdate ABC transporter substrate-binding protein [Pseudomonadota bacterium]